MMNPQVFDKKTFFFLSWAVSVRHTAQWLAPAATKLRRLAQHGTYTTRN